MQTPSSLFLLSVVLLALACLCHASVVRVTETRHSTSRWEHPSTRSRVRAAQQLQESLEQPYIDMMKESGTLGSSFTPNKRRGSGPVINHEPRYSFEDDASLSDNLMESEEMIDLDSVEDIARDRFRHLTGGLSAAFLNSEEATTPSYALHNWSKEKKDAVLLVAKAAGVELDWEYAVDRSRSFYGLPPQFNATTTWDMSHDLIIERIALSEMYASLFGSSWVKSDSWLSQSVSYCEWYGVICANSTVGDSKATSQFVVHMDLSGVGTLGSISSYISNLEKLLSLTIVTPISSTSLLETEITHNTVLRVPAELLNLSYLTQLTLSNVKLTDIPSGSYGSLVNLRYLDLSHNLFRGLPDTFFPMENLISVNVSLLCVRSRETVGVVVFVVVSMLSSTHLPSLVCVCVLYRPFFLIDICPHLNDAPNPLLSYIVSLFLKSYTIISSLPICFL